MATDGAISKQQGLQWRVEPDPAMSSSFESRSSGLEESDPEDKSNPDRQAVFSEYLYFHSHIGALISPSAGMFRRKSLSRLEVDLPDSADPLQFDVQEVSIRLFEPRTVLFLIHLTSRKPLSLNSVGNFSHRFRRAFAGYWDSDPERRNVPSRVSFTYDTLEADKTKRVDITIQAPEFLANLASDLRRDVLPHWKHLLEPLSFTKFTNSTECLALDTGAYEQIPCIRFIAIDQPQEVGAANLASVALGERLTNGYPDSFLASFAREHYYDRWWNPPYGVTRYLITEHAFTLLTGSLDPYAPVLEVHLQRQYVKLLMLAHLVKCGLIYHRENLFLAGKSVSSKDVQLEIVDRRTREYYEFLAAYWVTDVSGQEQGRELYRWIVSTLRLEELHIETKELAGLLTEYAETVHGRRTAYGTLQQTVVSTAGLALALAFGFWGMNLITPEKCCTLGIIQSLRNPRLLLVESVNSPWLFFGMSVVLLFMVIMIALRCWQPIARFLRIGPRD